mmetsp:Transcript_45362/g.82865  ORF Transcript_45362/g.82865 Transcript_45362/m.82865 type:complete len:728 (+) Transcript_45362:126-2309(+)
MPMECKNGCGRPRFRSYATCCTRCTGSDGPHANDCMAKCTKSIFKVGEEVLYLSTSRRAWLETRVKEVHVDGGIELDCKVGAKLSPSEFTTCVLFPTIDFVDKEGDQSRLLPRDGKLWWTLNGREVRANQLRISEAGDQQFAVTGPFGKADITNPPPGRLQREIMLKLCHNANLLGVPVFVGGACPDLLPVHTVLEADLARVSYNVGEALEYFSNTHGCWLDCTVVAVKDGAVQIDIKKDFWIAASDACSCLRQRDYSKVMSPSGASPKGGRTRLSSAPSADFVWVEKLGYLAGGDEDRVSSEEEAKRIASSDPEKYMGYTISVDGSMTFVRQQGSTFVKVPTFKSKILSFKALAHDGPLFEDKYCKNYTRFPGGLEGGSGSAAPWASWRRPGRGEGLYDRPGLCLFGSIHPNDLNQGAVGDCSLIAAISCLAEYPDALRKLFSRHTVSMTGKYGIHLYDWSRKGWRCFLVDDRVATRSPDHPEPVFVKASSELEIYPMLIEKAVAVMVGGFDRMNSIMPTWALGVLTGQPDVWHFTGQAGRWTGFRPLYDGTSTCVPVGQVLEGAWPDGGAGNVPKSDAEMWKALAYWDRANYLMVCGCAAVGKTDSQALPNGIIYTHAYSLVTVMTNIAGTGISLAQCRNPHGMGGREPNLPWKDHDPLWLKYPQVAAACHVTPESHQEDGLFWIQDRDWFGPMSSHFNSVYLVKSDMARQRSTTARIPLETMIR